MRKNIVIDTNVLISAFLFPQSKPAEAVRKAILNYTLCASEKTKLEFLEVARRKKFLRYFSSLEKREELINDLISQMKTLEPTEQVTDCQDPKDNKFLEIALSVGAKILVTGDKKDLISMNPFRGVEIITAREFLENY